MLAVIAAVIALIIFVVRALGGEIDADWGFAAVAAAIALLAFPGNLNLWRA